MFKNFKKKNKYGHQKHRIYAYYNTIEKIAKNSSQKSKQKSDGNMEAFHFAVNTEIKDFG
jgi:hypothetical protein